MLKAADLFMLQKDICGEQESQHKHLAPFNNWGIFLLE